MEVALAGVVAFMVTMAMLMALRRTLVSLVIGLLVLGNAVNLLVMATGRLTREAPPLVPPGASAPELPFANPLPQAFVLTAIVINFGLMAFSLVLMLRSDDVLGSLDPDVLRGPEDEAGGAEASR